jgi:hypothetical protein
MNKGLRALLSIGAVRAALVAAIVVLAWNVWLTVQTPRKIDPSVSATIGQGAREVDLLVRLDFPPERFHAVLLQKYGRVAQSQGNSLDLRGVRADNVDDVARYYWVIEVKPAS